MTNQVNILPMIALRGTTVLPDMIVHFDVSREKSIRAVEAAMLHDQKIFLLTQKDPEVEIPELTDLYQVGTVAYIKQVVKLPQDLYRVLVEGLDRAEVLGLEQEEPYLKAECEIVTAQEEDYPEPVKDAMLRSIRELFQRYCRESGKVSKDLVTQIMNIEDVQETIDQIAVNLPMAYQNKQKLLEAVSLNDRYEILGALLGSEIEVIHITKDLQRKVKSHIDKNQREYILREQLKTIREELGEENTADDIDEFKKQLKELDASDEVKEKISKEISRFKGMAASAAEATVQRGYLETVLALPWNKKSEDSEDLENAWKVLEEGHYGLKEVKERIMEFLAVRTLTKKGESPILCLVGPPGTGKTSIAKSVAHALNKEYVRISLGGVRDEAEIRGHRRTYVGAMPGRIANGMIQAGVKNPLMLLDEIDKVSSDYKGDTSSALLEVLDSEQNHKFRDHYVEIPLDLSEVLFIATANDLQTIPGPLLDRMEIIEVSSYTENEKWHIAKEHLIPKQIKAHGLKSAQLEISDEALREMITAYTREAGVRSLERKIGTICRKSARKILEEKESCVRVEKENLEEFLGRARYTFQKKNEEDQIGIVRGLAWTSVGGDTLQIEVNLMPGQGEFVLTGQMGDVMKESAQIGISYIRSIAENYQIDAEFFKNNDIHIHIPEGAVPKDGPSAGITMATAMLSAITKIPVKANLAMTGEITLRGRVLPIGGLKEKLLAAKNAGITTVLVPKENKPDVEELEKEITDGLNIIFVSSMEEVIKEAFTGGQV